MSEVKHIPFRIQCMLCEYRAKDGGGQAICTAGDCPYNSKDEADEHTRN